MKRSLYSLASLMMISAAASGICRTARSETTTGSAQTLAIDFKAGQHPISPLIYGAAYAVPDYLTDLNLGLNRWGGNGSSCFNWQLNAANYGSDWYFESLGSGATAPGDQADDFIRYTMASGAQPLMTIPTIGWVAKLGPNGSKLSSYSQAKYGLQMAADGDSGDGVLPGWNYIWNNDPNDANMPADSLFQQNWARHMVNTLGTAAKGGLTYYILDNEPALWHYTHRDVHPVGAKMDEMRDKIIDYAGKIKAVDPGAQIVGPEEWGWQAYFYSGYDTQYLTQHGWGIFPDRAAHNNMDVMPWLLDSLHKYDTANKTKSLDVFSLHYYPQGGEYSDDVTPAMQQRRNRSTRSLWDPNYVDETWINSVVQMIPLMKNWVNAYYPGLKTGITEYNFGAEYHINGGTTQADILGIFGREGLDMAAYWLTPPAGSYTASAFKMYRNVDGNNSGFGDISVSDAAPDPDNLSSFAAVRSVDGAQTVMVINKNLTTNYPVTMNLANCNAKTGAQVWQLTSTNIINRLPDAALVTANGKTTLQATVPAQSVTLFIVPGTISPAVINGISGLYSTGLDDNNIPVPDGGVDPHYKLVGTPAGHAGTPFITLQKWPLGCGLWMNDTAASKWISPSADENPSADAPGAYSYQTTFTVTGDPATAKINCKVAADDRISMVLLNGNPVATNLTGAFYSWNSFAITSGFVSGINTLQFVAVNAGTSSNPSGFRCELKGTAVAGGGGLTLAAPQNLAAATASGSPTSQNARLTTIALSGAAQKSNPVSYQTSNAQVPPVVLTWGASSGAASYNIKRSLTPGGPYTTIAGSAALTYTDAAVSSGVTYYYVVTAAAPGVESGLSNEASATPQSPVAPSPASITNLFSTGLDSAGKPAADAGNEAHYTLVSKPDGTSGTPFITMQQWPIVTNLWMLDTAASKWISPSANETPNADAPGDYTYQTTFTVNGDASFASLACKVAADDRVKAVILNGRTVAGNLTGAFYTWNSFAITSGFVSGTNTLQFVIMNAGTSPNPSGFRCELADTSGANVDAPDAPEGLAAKSGNAQVMLSWTPSTDADSYNVKRGTTTGGPYTQIASGVTAATYTDTTAANDTACYYVVSAVGRGGESDNSDEVSATPKSVGTVSGLFSTGLDSAGKPAADAGNEAHYTLVSKPDGTSGTPFITMQQWPIVTNLWMLDTAASKWISPSANETPNADAPGDYTYQTTFTITGAPGALTIQGKIAADDKVKAIILNGKTIASDLAGAFYTWNTFTLGSGLQTGTNTVQFIVTNGGTSPNPSGFRCEMTVGNN